MTFDEYLIGSGKKRAQAARELGVSRATVTNLCNGRDRPSLDLAFRITDWSGGAVPVEAWREAA